MGTLRRESMHNIITCEQVSDGHPDKLCDQISDAVVTDCLRHDPASRVAIECLMKDDTVVIAGELTSAHAPDYKRLVADVFERVGVGRLGYDMSSPKLIVLVKEQSMDISMGVDTGGAGDQGMMYGYATTETPELMPLPFMLATRFLQELKEYRGTMSWAFKADAKSQVSYDFSENRIDTFLCSVQHHPEVSAADIRPIIEMLMQKVADEYGLPLGFRTLVNPTGRFATGGPFADCGLTGRKLACDTYGGIGHIGGGAFSGKDPTKVDRSGAYMARLIARDVVLEGLADTCEVQLAYAIGVAEPVSVNVECFGTEKEPESFIAEQITSRYDLTPKGIISSLGLRGVDYNLTSAFGHFGKPYLPWEQYKGGSR